MAARLVSDIYNTPSLSLPVSSLTQLKGKLMMTDKANSLLVAATSSTTTVTLFGVNQKSIVSGTDTSVEVTPIITGPGQIWEVDCTNNTAADQLLTAMALTDDDKINNNTTTVSGPTGVFVCTKVVGAAADKKLQGYFIAAHQVTA